MEVTSTLYTQLVTAGLIGSCLIWFLVENFINVYVCVDCLLLSNYQDSVHCTKIRESRICFQEASSNNLYSCQRCTTQHWLRCDGHFVHFRCAVLCRFCKSRHAHQVDVQYISVMQWGWESKVVNMLCIMWEKGNKKYEWEYCHRFCSFK